jgi:hypothetical protein
MKRSFLLRFFLAIALFFLLPQILAEWAWKGTLWQDLLIYLSSGPVFGLAVALDPDPLKHWYLDLISAVLWFGFLAWLMPRAWRFFRHGVPAVVGAAALGILAVATVIAAVQPEPDGTIGDVVLSKVEPGMGFAEVRALVPRQWIDGMYGGRNVTPDIIRQQEWLSGTFHPGKFWNMAAKEFSLRRFPKSGSQEYACLYFDKDGKLAFWLHGPDESFR